METLRKILAAIFTIILSPFCLVLGMIVGLMTAPNLIAELCYFLSGQKDERKEIEHGTKRTKKNQPSCED